MAKAATCYRIGDWSIDPDRGLARSKDKKVHLEPKVIELLNYLAEQSGEVVSRDVLYEHFFDDDESVSNMLDVYIYKLRRKLGKDFIQTRRGAGYVVGA